MSDRLLEPSVSGEIVIEHGVLPPLQDDFDIAPGNGRSPPFVIDPPDLTEGFDFPAGTGVSRVGAGDIHDRDGKVALVQLDEHRSRRIQGSKSMSAYRRSGIRDHG